MVWASSELQHKMYNVVCFHMDQKATIITSVYFYILNNDVFKVHFYFCVFCLDFEVGCIVAVILVK